MSILIRLMRTTRHLPYARSNVFAVLGAVSLAGCGGLEPVASFEPITDPTQLYTTLTLNYAAANLALASTFDTLRLVATPRNALGEPIAGLPAPTFTSSDTASVKVSLEGLVTARKAVTGLRVIANLAASGNARHVDTVIINVTNLTPPPVLDSLIVDPLPPDSTIRALYGGALGTASTVAFGSLFGIITMPLAARAFAMGGTAMPGLAVEYASLDPTVATVDRRSGFMQGIRPGFARFVARTIAYGVLKADTVTFTITEVLGQDITIKRTPNGVVTLLPSEVKILAHGVVFWNNFLAEPVQVTFDDPTNVLVIPPGNCSIHDLLPTFFGPGPHCDGPGNISIPALDSASFGTVRGRRFDMPGVYPFHTTTGGSGRVIVTPFPVP